MNTQSKLHLRPATTEDAEMLFTWLNDEETRKNSRHSENVSWKEHIAWVIKSTNGTIPTRKLYIVEENGRAIGTVRTDKNEEGTELSWTVAPDARGHGYGKLMVLQLVREKIPQEKIYASILEGNHASESIAKALGLHIVKKEFYDDNNPRSFMIWSL